MPFYRTGKYTGLFVLQLKLTISSVLNIKLILILILNIKLNIKLILILSVLNIKVTIFYVRHQ